jgi:hypothetical protein
MNYIKTYNNLLNLIRECSDYLDKTFGFILPGSPTIIENVRAHYNKHPEDSHAMSCINI